MIGIDRERQAEFRFRLGRATVTTGPAGGPFYVVSPAVPLAKRSGAFAADVDVRADGAQSALAGLVHPTTCGRNAWVPGPRSESVLSAPSPPHLLPAVTRRRVTAGKGRSWRPHNPTTKFVGTLVEREFDVVRSAPAGRQSHLLSVMAFTLTRLVPAGSLTESTVDGALLADAGETMAGASIASGGRVGVGRAA